MPTLADVAKKFYQNYIGPTKDELSKGRKELDIKHPENEPPERVVGGFGTKALNVKKCQEVADQVPLFMKAARKKSRDSIRSWFRLEPYDKSSKPIETEMALLRAFEKRTHFKQKFEQAREAAYVSGNGYLLITFTKDADTKIYDPPKPGSCPFSVSVLDSKYIKELDYCQEPSNMTAKYKKLKIRHFHYVNDSVSEDYWIHPDRILHIPNDPTPGKNLGKSKVNLLRNIIKSTINVDIACGEILAWFAHGSYDIEEEGLDDNGRKYWEAVVKKHPGAYIHDETVKIQSVDPKAIDPKPFYDYLVLKIAGAFMMPMHVLTGIQVGKVTGAEVGMGDYVKDVKDDQDFVCTPLIEDLYSKILKANGKKWKYDIIWNAIYIDELAEAEILLKRIEAATLAMNGQRGAGGFINAKEARQIFNRGQIELADEVPKDIPKPLATPPNERAGNDDDDDDDEKPKKKDEGLYKIQLDEATMAMIEKQKIQAAKEKKIGKQILEEQDATDKS